jgi:glycerol-3-phosphate dehydrogenase (NAD(P)+)
MKKVAILGSGSWGTALAVHLARIGHNVCLWARDPSLACQLSSTRINAVYLPGVELPTTVEVTSDLAMALSRAELVVSAVPAQGTRHVIRAAVPFVHSSATVVSAAKGLEVDTLLRMSEVMIQELGRERRLAVLSGPSFAVEVARGLPTAVLVAAVDIQVAESVQAEFRSPYFRLYASTDVTGVEIGGALKNVIAIAAGVVEGLALGANARAGLITRGLAEITRLACAAGGRRETLSGLSGLGDLVLTCTGALSRNHQLGLELATGRTLQSILAAMKMVAEGVSTTPAALALGARYSVELPITTQMAEVLAGRRDARTAVEALMLRRQRAEAEPDE